MLTRIFYFYRNLIARQHIWLRAVAIFFCIGMTVGVIGYGTLPDLQENLSDMVKDIIGDSFTFDIPMAQKIFLNNITAALLMMFGGMIFGIVPCIAIFLNGFIIGYVITGVFFSSSFDILKAIYFSVATIIPHGIFEIPAVLISAAIGMRFGTEWMKKNPDMPRSEIFKKNFILGILYLPLLIGILFLAAFIEVFVSSRIGYSIMSDTP